jgi:hypothetical protein
MKSLAIGLAALTLFSLSLASPPAVSANDAAAAANPAEVAATQAALRDLWLGHIFWVREVSRAVADKNSAATALAEQQAVANAKAIAGSIEPFYGKPATEQLFKLLAGHYTAIKSHATANAGRSTADAKRAVDALTANANEIAVFLSGANPNLPEATLKQLLAAHGGHHVQQNQQLAAKDYAGEARTWEAMKTHIYTIADALGGALAKQFPAKF